jgi:putative signal transducing protein
MKDEKLVAVGTFLNKIEAEIAQGALEAAKIESMIAADDAGGTRPSLWMSGVQLLVRTGDAERARTILQQTDKKTPSSRKKTRKNRR